MPLLGTTCWPRLALCALLAGCDNPDAPGPRPSILHITLDTTRADHLGPYGYALAQMTTLGAPRSMAVVPWSG